MRGIREPLLLLCGIALWTFGASAQIGRPPIDESTAVNVGPFGGNLRLIDYARNNESVIYSAGTSGSLFRSGDGAAHWSRVSAGLPYPVLTSFSVDPQNPNRVLVSLNSGGKGVWMTLDGGNNWFSTPNPFGPVTIVNAIEHDPTNPNRVFAASTSGLYLSTVPLTNSSPNFTLVRSNSFRSIDIVDDFPNVIWAAGGNGIHKSTSGGAFGTWTGLSTSGITSSSTITVIEADSHNSSVAYVGGAGLFKTVNGGSSWQNIGSPLSGATTFNDILFASDSNALYVAYATGTTTGKIAKSVNGGINWNPLADLPGLPRDLSRASDGRLSAATDTGAYCSPNDGVSWSVCNEGLNASNTPVVEIYGDHGFVVSGSTLRDVYGFNLSTPGNWTDLLNPDVAEVSAIAAGPAFNPTTTPVGGPSRLYLGSVNSNALAYTTTPIGGIPQWTTNTNPFPTTAFRPVFLEWDAANSDVLWAGGFHNNGSTPPEFSNIYRGDVSSGTPSFTAVTDVPEFILFDFAQSEQNPLRKYTATEGGLYVTQDGGGIWTRAPGLSNTVVAEGVLVHPTNDQIVYANLTSPTPYIARSSDGGNTFITPTWPSGVLVYSMALDPLHPDTMWSGATTGGLLKSTDGGLIWSRVSGPFDNIIIYKIVATAAGQFIAATNNGLWTLPSTATATPPIITSHPQLTYVNLGGTATFQCSASGTPPLTFQWQVEDPLLSGFGTVPPGSMVTSTADSSTLTVPNVGLVDQLNPYRCIASNAAGSATSNHGIMYVVEQLLDRSAVSATLVPATPAGGLQQAATTATVTPPQPVTVRARFARHSWTVAANQPWVLIGGGSGSGTGAFTVGIDPATAPASGVHTATVTVTVPSVPVSQTLTVTLTVNSSSTLPTGSFDTPADGATNLEGSIPVTGWAIDDVGVKRVEIWRSCVETIDRPGGRCTSINGGPPNFVFVDNANFVTGARPDVEAANPTAPQANRAGWGYLLLSNFLPHIPNATGFGGQGTMTLYAYAIDEENNYALLGSKTITLNNDQATLPFGAIDTPTQGGTVTTNVYVNFGWAMAPGGNCIDTTTIAGYQVFIDGVPRPLTLNANWIPGLERSDLVAAFPGLCNTNNALAAYYINVGTLGLSTGVHTIAWVVTDLAGHAAGIGSRFFSVAIGSSQTTAPAMTAGTRVAQRAGPNRLSSGRIRAHLGFGEDTFVDVKPSSTGELVVDMPATGRVVLDLDGAVSDGHLEVSGSRRTLPHGSTLDADAGRFSWQPPIGFLGDFRLIFVAGDRQIPVTIRIGPGR